MNLSRLKYSALILAFVSQLALPRVAHADGLGDAERLYVAGQYKQAQALTMNVVEKSPDKAAPQYLLGNIDFKLGDLYGARSHYNQAAKLEPNSDAAAMSLAMLNKLATMPRTQAYLPPAVSNYSKANFFSQGANTAGRAALVHQQRLPNGSFGTVNYWFDGTITPSTLPIWSDFYPGELDKAAFSAAADRMELESEMSLNLKSLETREAQDILSIEKQRKLAYDSSRNYEEEISKVREMANTVASKIRSLYAGREAGSAPPEKTTNTLARFAADRASIQAGTAPGQFNQPQFNQSQFNQLQFNQPQFNQPQFNQSQFNQLQFNQPQFNSSQQFNQSQPDRRLAPFGNNLTTKNYMVTPSSDSAQIELKANQQTLGNPSTENVKK